jgi:hypothetical protein
MLVKMESNKYDIENFENFLREKTDEFRMYPSKRVWYSIYNNMHPGNRLPSVSMTIVLIGFLFLVGFLNTSDVTKEKNTAAKNTYGNVQIAALPAILPKQSEHTVTTASLNSKHNTSRIASAGSNKTFAENISTNSFTSVNEPGKNGPSATSPILFKQTGKRPTVNITSSINENVVTEQNTIDENALAASTPVESLQNDLATITTANKQEQTTAVGLNTINTSNSNKEVIANVTIPVNTTAIENVTNEEKSSTNTDNKDTKASEKTTEAATTNKNIPVASIDNKNRFLISNKSWIEDFAFHNKPVAKKWAGKLSVQAYITPSIVYRKFRNNAVEKQLAGTNSNFNYFNVNDVVTHKPSFGIETGLSLQYDIAKRIKIKAGLQANYTRYNAFAYETNHPVAATLSMNADDNRTTYEVFRTANYTNIYGQYSTKLHNETYQLSIPFGVDYKLINISENISWYAGATIQPTIVLFAKSFVLSTDRRSYVNDPSLLNRFNMNAGFETYFSYQRSGYTLQLGPQYRTQLFSTNTKIYTLEERLQNFGFKVGITKRL